MNSLFAQTRNSNTPKNLLKDIVAENLTIKDFILQLTRKFFLLKHKEMRNMIFSNGLFGSLKRGESKGGVEGKRVVGRRVKGNGYPPPCLDVFKISKGEGNN